MISSVDLAYYGVSRAKDWVSVDCSTMFYSAYFVKSTIRTLIGSFQHFADMLNMLKMWMKRFGA